VLANFSGAEGTLGERSCGRRMHGGECGTLLTQSFCTGCTYAVSLVFMRQDRKNSVSQGQLVLSTQN
jgi:hypothetical protein